MGGLTMNMGAIDVRERLILALDVPSAEAAFRLLERAGDAVTFVKVGLELFTAAGPELSIACGISRSVCSWI